VAAKRNPKGTYTRDTGDWFVDKLQSAYVDIGALGGLFSIASLFNNSNTAENLYVYGLYSWLKDPLQYGVLQFSLGQQGSPPAQGTNPIGSINPLVSGLVTFTYTNDSAAQQIGVIGGGNLPMTIFSRFPLAIVPSGSALSIRSSGGTVTHVAGFWWVALAA